MRDSKTCPLHRMCVHRISEAVRLSTYDRPTFEDTDLMGMRTFRAQDVMDEVEVMQTVRPRDYRLA